MIDSFGAFPHVVRMLGQFRLCTINTQNVFIRPCIEAHCCKSSEHVILRRCHVDKGCRLHLYCIFILVAKTSLPWCIQITLMTTFLLPNSKC